MSALLTSAASASAGKHHDDGCFSQPQSEDSKAEMGNDQRGEDGDASKPVFRAEAEVELKTKGNVEKDDDDGPALKLVPRRLPVAQRAELTHRRPLSHIQDREYVFTFWSKTVNVFTR
jgi:hypothetical protein